MKLSLFIAVFFVVSCKSVEYRGELQIVPPQKNRLSPSTPRGQQPRTFETQEYLYQIYPDRRVKRSLKSQSQFPNAFSFLRSAEFTIGNTHYTTNAEGKIIHKDKKNSRIARGLNKNTGF